MQNKWAYPIPGLKKECYKGNLTEHGSGNFVRCAVLLFTHYFNNMTEGFLRVTEPWPRLPREAVESPSLEIFQPRLAAVLCSPLWVTLLGQGVGLGDPQRSLPPLPFCDSVIQLENTHTRAQNLSADNLFIEVQIYNWSLQHFFFISPKQKVCLNLGRINVLFNNVQTISLK